MIRKSGNRFSEKNVLKQRDLVAVFPNAERPGKVVLSGSRRVFLGEEAVD
jgi:hypothetical protein